MPFVYRKFFPLGSPLRTVGLPLVVLGKEENIAPKIIKKMYNQTCICYIPFRTGVRVDKQIEISYEVLEVL